MAAGGGGGRGGRGAKGSGAKSGPKSARAAAPAPLAPAPLAPAPLGPAPIGPAPFAPAPPGGTSVGAAGAGVVALQRGLGNAAVGRLVREGLPEPVRTELERPGQPLDAGVRARLERRFGADFGQVRVHVDDSAASSARAVHAGAYAVGERVVFGPGRYDPSSPLGLRLLAHELAHVLQQRRGGPSGGSPLGDHALEAAAEQAADTYLSTPDGRIEVGGASPGGLSLSPEDEPSMSDYGKAYQRLRQLEEDSDAASVDMHKHGVEKLVDRRLPGYRAGRDVAAWKEEHPKATKAQIKKFRDERTAAHRSELEPGSGPNGSVRSPATPAERDALRNQIAKQVTVSAGYGMDADDRVHMQVSTNAARRDLKHDKSTGPSAIEKEERQTWNVPPNAQWTAAAPPIRKPKLPKGVMRSNVTVPGGAGTAANDAGSGDTFESTNRHAEANHAAHSTGAHPLMTAAANRDTCPFCARRLLQAGATTATRLRNAIDPADPNTADPNVARNVTRLARERDRPPPGAPVVEQRYPGRRSPSSGGGGPTGGGAPGGGPSGGGGPASPPPAGRSTMSSAAKTGAGQPATASGKGGPPVATSRASVKTGTSGTAAQAHPSDGDTVTATRPAPGTSARARTGAKSSAATPTPKAAPPTPKAPVPLPKPSTLGPAPSGIAPSPKQSGIAPTPRPAAASSGTAAHAPAVATGTPTGPAAKPGSPAPKAVTVPAAPTGPAAVTGKPAATKPAPVRTSKWSGDASKVGHTTTTTATYESGTSTTRKTTTAGTWGSISRSQVDAETTGGKGTQRTQVTGLSRKDGKLGINRSTLREKGDFDEHGVLKKGTSAQTAKGGGLLSDDHGTGLFGDVSHTRRQVHGNGFSTSQSIGASGQFQVHAEPIKDTNPVRYKVSLTITLGANASLGAGVGQDTSVNLSAGGSASVTGTFSSEMSEAEMHEYVGALKRNGEGGVGDEQKIIRLAAHGGLADARKMLAALQSGKLSGDLAAGDEVSLEKGGALNLAGGATLGKEGGPSIGAQVTYSRSRRIKFTRVDRDGKMILTVTVIDATNRGASVHGSLEFAGGGAEIGDEKTVGRSVTFAFTSGDKTKLDAALGIDSAEQLDTLAGHNSGVVLSDTHAHGVTNRHGVSADALGLEFTFNQDSGYDEAVTHSAEGDSLQVAGHSGGGAGFGIKDGPKLKAGQRSTITSEVGPDGKATGDLNTTSSETTLHGIIGALKKKADTPIKSAADAATGSKPVVDSTSEGVGMKLSDGDYATLQAVAEEKDGRAWEKAFIGHTGSIEAWRHLRHQIANAGGDRAAMARALAHYADDNDRSAEAVAHVIRPTGSVQGGVRYDFPEGMEEQQNTYNSLVVGNPLAAARALSGSGRVDDAIARLTADAGALDRLGKTIHDQPDKFVDKPAVTEMQRRIVERSAQLRNEAGKLRTESTAVYGPPTVEQQKASDEQQQCADHAAHQQEAAGYIASLQDNQRDERQKFAKVNKELNDTPWYRSTDVTTVSQDLTALKHNYVEWDATIVKLKAALQADGQDPATADKYAPDRGTWNTYNNHPEMTKWR